MIYYDLDKKLIAFFNEEGNLQKVYSGSIALEKINQINNP